MEKLGLISPNIGPHKLQTLLQGHTKVALSVGASSGKKGL